MNGQHFTTSFSVDQAPAEVFRAITNVRGRWSEQIEGRSESVGDTFTYRHGNLHQSTQKLTEVIPSERVVWLVVDGYLSFVEKKGEWKGTQVIFDVSTRPGGNTRVRVTHEGLNPSCECFEACSKGWGFYINQSLRKLITTGSGRPDPKVGGAAGRAQ